MNTRAAVFHAPGLPLEVAEIELDEPRAEEVLVRMAAVGICGTDLHMVKGEWERPTPMVLGHEGAGLVEAVGDGVTSVAPGDAVVLSWAPSCGSCADCKRGRPAACLPLQYAIGGGTLLDGQTGMKLRGETLYRGTATGALSERLVVSERVALPLGEGVPLDEAALLGCAALTGVGAVLFAAKVEEGASVLVVGAGGVGQFVVQGARIAGAREIVCCDPLEERLALTSRLGATHVVGPDELRAFATDAFPDGFDYAFDAVGDPATTKDAFRWTRNGGLCVIVGLPAAGARLELDPTEFIRREKRLTGTIYGSEDPAIALPVLLEHVRAGRLDLASQLGPSFALDDVNDAVDAALAGVAGRVSFGSDVGAEHVERGRVAWVDTDAGGRIHFTAAFRWAEAAETSLLRALGLVGRSGDYPRRHVQADFLRVLVFEDEFETRLRVQQVGRTSVTYAWEIVKDGEPCVVGSHTAVLVGAGGRPEPIPDDVRSALEVAT